MKYLTNRTTMILAMDAVMRDLDQILVQNLDGILGSQFIV